MLNNTKVWTLASLMILGGGGIVSCSDDYDDDIKKNESAINGLSTQLTALQTALDQAKSDAQSAHAKFVTQTELNNVEAATKAAAQEAAATAKAEALTEAINQCKALISGKADQTALDALSNKVNSIDATLNKLGDVATQDDLKAAKENLQAQINALNYLKEILPAGTDFQSIINELATLKAELEVAQDKLNNLKPTDVSDIKTTMNSLSQKVNEFSSDINVLTVLVNKMLTSVTLIPQLYSDGIEAVSFDYLAYYPVVAGTSGNTTVTGATLQRIDKGETVISYRLNPTTVELSSIDVDNIGFVGHTAKKQESRAAEQSPILYQGLAENGYQNGVLKVMAKRNPSVDLTATGSDNIWVAAIKVPRKADVATGADYAEIYSEYSMVLEQTFTPQIAQVDLSKASGLALIPGKKAYGFNGKTLNIVEALAGANNPDGWSATLNHYYNKEFLYETKVDADSYVTLEIPFNQTFDLSQLVTGCKTRDYEDRPESTHYQITREDLASYGLELVFSIPTQEYIEDVDNKTNQQKFAKILEDGKTIMSTTPAGNDQNEAVIGKEPIVMVQLVDKNNQNKLVDERYFKIKWAALEPVVDEQKTINLKNYASTVVLNPCGEMVGGSITWSEFIDEVYAKIGDNGMSQSDFEKYYTSREVTPGNWTLYHQAGSSANNGKYEGTVPVIKTTTNEHGDALMATWTITADDAERVIVDNTDIVKAANNFKEITATVTMTPTEKSLPILKFNWTLTITVPTLPSLVGYYDQYWYEKYSVVDVLPVQYKTPAQENGNYHSADYANPNGKYETCVYDFNLTNAFVYEQVNNQVKYIVKDFGSCGSYDIQFRKSQSMTGWTSPSYTNKWTNNNEPDPATELWSSFAGYQLNKGANKALQMYWVEVAGREDYKMMSTPVAYNSWELENSNWRSAKIFASSANKAGLAGLLNPLSQENEVSELGQKQPVRTHNNKVNMGIWARLNNYNYILVKSYDLCLIAPLRVDALAHDGAFEDGHVSGTSVTFNQIFSMTDFRGYLVAKKPTKAVVDQYTPEQAMYADSLYNYYEVQEPVVNTDAITYNFKLVNGTVQIDPSKTNWMTADELYRLTNGNLNFSIVKSGDTLTFYNNGGSNIETMCYAKIPCSVQYGFGSATSDILVPIYPHGSNN